MLYQRFYAEVYWHPTESRYKVDHFKPAYLTKLTEDEKKTKKNNKKHAIRGWKYHTTKSI